MKKLAFTLIALLLAFALTFAACGETPDPTEPAESESGSEAAPAEDDSIEEATAGMPNPMEKLEGPAKFEHDLGFTLDAPEGAEDVSYYVISGQIAEVGFWLGDHGFNLRATKEEGDVSGLFGESVSKETLDDGTELETILSGEAEWYCLRWTEGDIYYTLTNTDGAAIADLTGIYNAVK
ncbi:MAG: hypothetical protein IK104_03355 [Clostridia bacterium]|nr:hypothetical protein [Clostridia bacterium]